MVMPVLIFPILWLVTVISISIAIHVTLTCMSMFIHPSLVPPTHLMYISAVDIVTSFSVSIPARVIIFLRSCSEVALPGWSHLEYKANGVQKLTRVHYSYQRA